LKKLNLFIFLFIPVAIQAQNLLPNAGFEEVNVCCENSKMCCPKGWFKTNFSKYTTTSYPRPGMKESLAVEVTGAAIGGNNYRTYIQAPVLCPLMPGTTYTLSMYVQPKQFALDELEAYFSDTFVVTFSDSRLIVPYQVVFKNERSFIGKKNKWQKIEASYTATGNEKFVVIGNFKVDSLLHWKRLSRSSEMCMYGIDSVSLTSQSDSAECDIQEMEAIYYRETRRHNYKKSCQGSINLFEHLLQKDTKPDSFFTQKPVILKNVFFDFDQSSLLPASYKELNILFEYLLARPEYSIAISGHTDAKGSDGYNMRLSSERALAVGNYLIQRGIDRRRITTTGKGSTEPIADNATDEGREQNRRVEFIIFE
jgi:OOP family OmpA-OmpF porin